MNNFLEYFSIFFLILLTLLFLSKYRQNQNNKSYIFICVYLTYISVIQLTSGLMFYFGINNRLFSHFYFIGEFITLSLFYRQLFSYKQKKNADALILFVCVILAILFIISTLGYYTLSAFDPLEISLSGLPILVFAIIHLYNSLSKPLKFFHLTIGVLIYKTVSVLAFILQYYVDYVDYFDNLSIILWKLNAVFVLVYYSLIFFEWNNNFRQNKVS